MNWLDYFIVQQREIPPTVPCQKQVAAVPTICQGRLKGWQVVAEKPQPLILLQLQTWQHQKPPAQHHKVLTLHLEII